MGDKSEVQNVLEFRNYVYSIIAIVSESGDFEIHKALNLEEYI